MQDAIVDLLLAADLCLLFYLPQGASYLARALRANSTLKEIDLRWNEVGNDGARAIRDCLDTNRSLTTIQLSGNKARCQNGEILYCNSLGRVALR